MNMSGVKQALYMVVGVASIGFGGLAGAAVLQLTPSTGSYTVGEEVVVTISADSEGDHLVVADAIVNYDSKVLELLDIGTDVSSFAYNFGLAEPALFPIKVINNTTGQAQVVVALPSPGVNGANLTVANLKFRALAVSPQTAVTFSYAGAGKGGDSNAIIDDGNGTDGLSSVLNATYTVVAQTDTDGDGVPDNADNCIDVANANQRDTDSDGYGNLCDGDLNNDGATNTLDLNLLKLAYRSAAGDANYNVNADLNGDGVINTLDLNIFKGLYRKPPGPSCCGAFQGS
jgi:hypothetical protein